MICFLSITITHFVTNDTRHAVILFYTKKFYWYASLKLRACVCGALYSAAAGAAALTLGCFFLGFFLDFSIFSLMAGLCARIAIRR